MASRIGRIGVFCATSTRIWAFWRRWQVFCSDLYSRSVYADQHVALRNQFRDVQFRRILKSIRAVMEKNWLGVRRISAPPGLCAGAESRLPIVRQEFSPKLGRLCIYLSVHPSRDLACQ